MKILLIETPFYRLYKNNYALVRYPLSLAYLAGAIKKNTNWDVMAYNADFTPNFENMTGSGLSGEAFRKYLVNLNDLSGHIWQEIRQTISEYKPDVVGISVKSPIFTAGWKVAKIVKEISRKTIVIVGGPHPTMVGKKVFDDQNIDINVTGEGELTITELLDAIAGKGSLQNINGILYRQNGTVVENPKRAPIQDLDSLTFPHETAPEILKDYDIYPPAAFRFIFAIRGCPFDCFFCGSRNVWGRRVRFRSVENVVAEIKSLKNMGLKIIHFDDDTFGVKKKYIHELCEAIEDNCPGLKWSCELHANLVDDKTIEKMKSAGCFSIQIGVESGSNQILKDMRKNTSIEEIFAACDTIKKYGIELQTFFIIGFPQETEETLKATLDALKRINCDVLVNSIFTPYPGTESFEVCKEKGLIDEHFDISLYNHTSPENNFTLNISKERFRELADQIGKMVDRRNNSARRKRLFSMNTILKLQEEGLLNGLKRGVKILTGK
ncbi:MAG: B12-binding domain-containing radical SAM protein [Candidatus Zixiibacteriota bacterium]